MTYHVSAKNNEHKWLTKTNILIPEKRFFFKSSPVNRLRQSHLRLLVYNKHATYQAAGHNYRSDSDLFVL